MNMRMDVCVSVLCVSQLLVGGIKWSKLQTVRPSDDKRGHHPLTHSLGTSNNKHLILIHRTDIDNKHELRLSFAVLIKCCHCLVNYKIYGENVSVPFETVLVFMSQFSYLQ